MDETLIANWNSVIRPEDIVYHLGDVYFGSSEKADLLLSRLMGRKRLLLGNHDDGKDPVLHKHFQKIEIWRMWPEFGLIFSHVPLHSNALNPAKCPKNVHGHIHNNVDLKDERYINVSVEMTDYKPVNIEELRVWKK
jgi:calcineurin-like phosphoesterase family protein